MISPIELVYYAPHVLREATSAQDIQDMIDADTASLASSLQLFLDRHADSAVPSIFELMSSDDIGEDPVSRREFRLWEILGDVSASHTSPFLACAAPSLSGTLDLRPFLACSVESPWVTIDEPSLSASANFASGMVVEIQAPAGSRTQHTVDSADGSRLLLTNTEALQGQSLVNIVGVVSSDPVRVLKVQSFHASRGNGGDAPPGSITSFNEGLYRLLYTPSDPSLPMLGTEEIYNHYVDHPGSVGSLSELLSAASMAGGRDATQIASRLTLGTGASIVFGDPMSGEIQGVTTADKSDADYGSDLGVDQDKLVPTSAAVRSMIRSSVPDPEAEHFTRYLEVEDVLYASREHEGVHCPGRVTVGGDIQCQEMQCDRVARIETLAFTNGVSSGDLSCEHVGARSLSVSQGAVCASESGLAVNAPLLEARACSVEDLNVRCSANFSQGVNMSGTLHASDIRATGSVQCRDIRSFGALFEGDMFVSGQVAATSLEIDGVDVLKELGDIWAAVRSLSR